MANALYTLLAALVASSLVASQPMHRSAASELHSAYVSPSGSDEEGSGTLLKPFKTVRYALERLADHGTLHVYPGVYTGSENFPSFTKNTTVSAYGGSPANTVFDAQASSLGFRLSSVSTVPITVTIKGLGITNFVGSTSVGAVYVLRGTVNIQDCSFTKISGAALNFHTGNQTVSSTNFEDVSTGVSFPSGYSNTGSVSIRDCNFVSGGTAISVRTGPTKIVADNLRISEFSRAFYWTSEYSDVMEISNTEVDGAALGMLYARRSASGSGKVEIRLNKVTATRCGSPTASGGAIYATEGVNIIVTSSTFQDNVAKQGGAIYCSGATMNLQNTKVQRNAADDGGAGYCTDNCAFSSLGGSETANTNDENTHPCF